jgi:hypothetical protein
VRRWLALSALAAASLVTGTALACGAPFGNNIAVNPEQDIIVAWKDGVETYVFQPIFCGTASEFGLVLPVPAPLAQQPALSDPQAFTKAAALAAPKKVTVEQSHGVGCAGGSDSAGGKGGIDNTTTVVASGHVGFLDWVQIKADTAAALADWLTSNGYPYSSAAASVFAYYVDKGWYFIAFRISHESTPDGGTICKALGPIALSFPSPAPVVPTRMATAGAALSTGGQRFAWRIFGITRGSEQLGRAGAISYTDGGYTMGYSGAIAAADVPALAGLAEAGDRLTRLIVRFGYNSTSDDVAFETAAPVDYRDEEYVTVYDDAACSLGMPARSRHSVWLTLFGLTAVGLLGWRRVRRGRGRG